MPTMRGTIQDVRVLTTGEVQLLCASVADQIPRYFVVTGPAERLAEIATPLLGQSIEWAWDEGSNQTIEFLDVPELKNSERCVMCAQPLGLDREYTETCSERCYRYMVAMERARLEKVD